MPPSWGHALKVREEEEEEEEEEEAMSQREAVTTLPVPPLRAKDAFAKLPGWKRDKAKKDRCIHSALVAFWRVAARMMIWEAAAAMINDDKKHSALCGTMPPLGAPRHVKHVNPCSGLHGNPISAAWLLSRCSRRRRWSASIRQGARRAGCSND